MAMPPLAYNLRSLLVRRTSTLLTVVGIGATVAVLAGILSLQQGFAALYEEGGREDVVIFMRPGATSEGESYFSQESGAILMKETPEIATADGQPLAGGELYLAVRRRKVDGGETNVPIRGVETASFEIAGDKLVVTEGRRLAPGTDEVMVGRSLKGRIRGCQLDQVIEINTTPFRVVGIFDYDGPFSSEIWGDLRRMREALQRPGMSRVVARVRPGTDIEAMDSRQESDDRVPGNVMSEQAYLSGQTGMFSGTLALLAGLLSVVMGTAAVFTGTNTMLSALASRSHEIGILLSIGFRPASIFFSFLFEAVALGLMGGVAGCLLVLPLHGVDTGTTNFQTFTEVAFAFKVTPRVLVTAMTFAGLLGLLGGMIPAWNAARRDPVDALRRR